MSSNSQFNEDPSFGKPLLIGAVLGFLTLTAGGTVIGLQSGFDRPGAFGLAVFAACFGGIGFGCMFGAVYAITRPVVAPEVPAAADAEGPAETAPDAAEAA